MTKPVIIFDTSGFNALFKDRDFKALNAGIKAGFIVYITEASAAEIVATPDTSWRNYQLDGLQSLLSEGRCILPYHVIIERLATGFVGQEAVFDWTTVNVRFPACEQEIVRRIFTDDTISRKQREQAAVARKEFEGIYKSSAWAVQDLFDGDSRPSREDFIRSFKEGNGPTWGIGKSLFERATKSKSSGALLRQFYDICPPFRALMVSAAVADYERCLRNPNSGERSMKAGRTDLSMATYLPYCDKFITADGLQCDCLDFVAAHSGLPTSVSSFRVFKERLLGLSSQLG